MPALSQSGGGYQVGDGNASEVTMYQRGVPNTYGTAQSLTLQDLANGAVYVNAAIVLTSPTGLQLDAGLPNAKVGSTFDIILVPTLAVAVQMATAAGITGLGSFSAGAASASLQFQYRKTGDGTWNLLRIA